MSEYTKATAIAIALLAATASASASVPFDSFAAGPNAPKADAFTTWGSSTNGLEAAIMGPAISSLNDTEYFVALRNVSGSTIYFFCGVPWPTLLLTSKTGSTIAPTDTPRRSVYSGFTDTIELGPNEAWVLPNSMTLRTSYKTSPHNVAGAVYDLEVSVGSQSFSSCRHSTVLTVQSAPLETTLE